MKKHSAGLLIYRKRDGLVEVLIAHPGGPFFAKKDNGVWSIPKGLYNENETPLTAAKREFEEEIGTSPPAGEYLELGEIKRKDGKYIIAWAAEGDIDEEQVRSNTFEIEWPPQSGKLQEFPEIDKAQWFDLDKAAPKLQPAQVEFLKRLAGKLGLSFDKPAEPPSQGSLF